MSSLSSVIYDHMPYLDALSKSASRCSCGVEFHRAEDARARWAIHLTEVIDKSFINVTHIPAGPAAPPQPVEELAEVSISINGELHSVIYAKPRRVKA